MRKKHFYDFKNISAKTENLPSKLGNGSVRQKSSSESRISLTIPLDEIFSAETMKNLLNYETAGTSYRYNNGYNEITIFSTKATRNIKIPGGKTTIAILCAIAISFLVGQLPAAIQGFIVNDLTIPLLNALISVIVGVAVPTIFISIVASICVMDDIATLNDIGLKVIKRFMLSMLLCIVVAAACCELFFHVITLESDEMNFQNELITLLIGVIPKSLFTLFIEGNILQIAILAFATGACIVILDKRVASLKIFISELKNLLTKLMGLSLSIVNFTIFLGIFEVIMTASLATITQVWKILAVTFIAFVITAIILLIVLKLRYKISIKDFLSKNAETLKIALTIGTMPAMTPAIDTAKKKLKIEPELVDFWVPLAYALYSPGNVARMMIAVFVGAVVSHDTLSIMQLVVAAFLSIQLAIVTPKVSGGSMATYTILMNQFGFEMEAVGLLMMSEVFTANITSGFGMFVRGCELFDLSHKIKLKTAK